MGKFKILIFFTFIFLLFHFVSCAASKPEIEKKEDQPAAQKKVKEEDLLKLLEKAKKPVEKKTEIDSLKMRISRIENMMEEIEGKIAFNDSLTYDIKSQLFLMDSRMKDIEKKIENVTAGVQLAGKQKKLSPQEYKKMYSKALSLYRTRKYRAAIKIFESLIKDNPYNNLADNSQYWIAESYYGMGKYRRAIIEFEKVFTFNNTNKADSAQLKLGLCYLMLGDVKRARDEFQRFIEYYSDSEYLSKAKKYLEQL